METILTVNQLTKSYGSLFAVKKLSFSIEKGHVYGILGPNGSGKSTTLGMVLNVVNPTQGSFQWFEGTISTHQALKKVGAIIERPNFYPYMTAVENLKLVSKIKGVSSETISEKLELVGLLDRKDSKFQSYSLGMKQRLAIASALLNNPEILILDEPTNGLDPQGIYQIREIIKKIASQGTTILLASHLLEEVEKVCTHVVVLRKGEKLYAGPVTEMQSNHGYVLLNSAKADALKAHLEESEDFEKISLENGLIKAYLTKPIAADKLNKRLMEDGFLLSHLAIQKDSLEAQFLALTNNKYSHEKIITD